MPIYVTIASICKYKILKHVMDDNKTQLNATITKPRKRAIFFLI